MRSVVKVLWKLEEKGSKYKKNRSHRSGNMRKWEKTRGIRSTKCNRERKEGERKEKEIGLSRKKYIRKIFREQVRKEQQIRLLTWTTRDQTSGLPLVVDLSRLSRQVQPSQPQGPAGIPAQSPLGHSFLWEVLSSKLKCTGPPVWDIYLRFEMWALHMNFPSLLYVCAWDKRHDLAVSALNCAACLEVRSPSKTV